MSVDAILSVVSGLGFTLVGIYLLFVAKSKSRDYKKKMRLSSLFFLVIGIGSLIRGLVYNS